MIRSKPSSSLFAATVLVMTSSAVAADLPVDGWAEFRFGMSMADAAKVMNTNYGGNEQKTREDGFFMRAKFTVRVLDHDFSINTFFGKDATLREVSLNLDMAPDDKRCSDFYREAAALLEKKYGKGAGKQTSSLHFGAEWSTRDSKGSLVGVNADTVSGRACNVMIFYVRGADTHGI